MPTVPGSDGLVTSDEQAMEVAREVRARLVPGSRGSAITIPGHETHFHWGASTNSCMQAAASYHGNVAVSLLNVNSVR